jgi:sulfoxide reductase heme-binding subunit YedZ
MKLPRFSKFQLLVHIGALVPLLWLIWDFFMDNLTANPIQAVTLRTGKTALVLLVLTLAVTPINTLFGFRQLLKVRRALGLYTFLYVSIHFAVFIGLDYVFDLELILEAIFEKRFALIGFITGLIMLPLALTSTRGWMKRLGKNWKRIHWLIYLAGLLAVLHYTWSVKSDIRQPVAFGVVVVLLLIARIPVVRRSLSRLRWKFSSKITDLTDRVRRFISQHILARRSRGKLTDLS